MTEYTITVHPFSMGTDKEAALKPLEEAAEIFGMWQICEDTSESGNAVMDRWLIADLADEIADCITACCNLAARYGIDINAAIQRVEEKNRERGRYDRA